MAGYSGTPLERKLGIKPGHTITLINDPGTVPLELPAGVTVRRRVGGTPLDLVLAFFVREADLRRRIGPLGRAIVPNGAIWVAWPKKASGVPTDITDHVIRAVALPLGLVDVKVAAVDDTWTGIKLVWRLSTRRKQPRR